MHDSSAIRQVLRLTTAMLLLGYVTASHSTVGPTEWVKTGKVTSPLPTPGAAFGQQMAFDGDTIVVGVDEQAFSTGAVFVFTRNPWGRWILDAQLQASDGGVEQRFGAQVDVDGDTIVVASGPVAGPGEIYVFDRNAQGKWVETTKLSHPDPGDPDNGLNIPSLDGEVLAVGASDDTQGPLAGAVYIFERNAGGPDRWGWTDKLIASDAFGGECFAFPAVDGDRLAVGAPRDHAPDDDEGSVYIFETDVNGSWIEIVRLNASDAGEDDEFGLAVDLEGDVLVAGAPFNDEVANQAGAAYVFERTEEGAWSEVAKLTPLVGGVDANFGSSLAMDDGIIVVGASQGFDEEGAVYVYERDSEGEWIELQRIVLFDGGVDDSLGKAVAIGRSAVIATDHVDDELGFNTGAFYVFDPTVSPSLVIAGSCPGEVSIQLSGATSLGSVAVVQDVALGTRVLPGGPCPGLELGVEEPKLLSAFGVDANGEKALTFTVPAGVCGRHLQAVDVTTCTASSTVQLSE